MPSPGNLQTPRYLHWAPLSSCVTRSSVRKPANSKYVFKTRQEMFILVLKMRIRTYIINKKNNQRKQSPDTNIHSTKHEFELRILNRWQDQNDFITLVDINSAFVLGSYRINVSVQNVPFCKTIRRKQCMVIYIKMRPMPPTGSCLLSLLCNKGDNAFSLVRSYASPS